MNAKNKGLLALIVVSMLGGLLSGIYFRMHTQIPTAESPKQSPVNKAQFLQGGDFELEDKDGVVRMADFAGKPLILYFGYTYCPDVCPTGLAVLREVIAASDDKLQVAFITLDPQRDTAPRMAEYAGFFSPQIRGLTGSQSAIEDVLKRYGVYSRKVISQGREDDYTMDHSAGFFLLDKRGRLVTVLPHFSTKDDILHELDVIN
ncbi:MAG: SCO family protein [Hahellaceae bacterium]|nr:SCO family protein [Hahellaceae bacterium]